jgi:ATP-dependent DNA ligase
MSLHPRTLPAGFIAPCLPSSAPRTPSGAEWLHEIKHDGFRVIARKDANRVKLYSRPGNDLTDRFPLIVDALAKLRSQSCIIDGEAVACGDDGISSFDRIRYGRHDASVFLYAFDLIELNGGDLRRDPLAVRKATLAARPCCAGAPVQRAPGREGWPPGVRAGLQARA